MADELQLEELFISHLEDQELTTAFDRLRPEIATIIAGNAQLELIATGAEDDRKFMVENPRVDQRAVGGDGRGRGERQSPRPALP